MRMISFTVIGKPEPQGSTRAFVPKGWKRAIITSANKNLKPWRQDVADMAILAMKEANQSLVVRPGAVRVTARFYFDRPKSQKKAQFKTTAADVDKLVRSLFDSMSGVCYEDDAQVVECIVNKRYGQPARAEIAVERYEPGAQLL